MCNCDWCTPVLRSPLHFCSDPQRLFSLPPLSILLIRSVLHPPDLIRVEAIGQDLGQNSANMKVHSRRGFPSSIVRQGAAQFVPTRSPAFVGVRSWRPSKRPTGYPAKDPRDARVFSFRQLPAHLPDPLRSSDPLAGSARRSAHGPNPANSTGTCSRPQQPVGSVAHTLTRATKEDAGLLYLRHPCR